MCIRDSPEAVAKAQAAGAKGFKLVGCTCVGQDLQLRGAHYTEVFEGHAGNNYTSEAVLATGGIDAVLSEFNCTLPGIEPICDELKIKQICLDDVAKKANAKMMPFDFDRREEQSMEIIDEIVEAYKARRGNVPMNLFPEHGNDDTLTGVSEVSLKKFLGDTWKPLIDLIVSGDIKGIAGVVGCSNLTAGGHDVPVSYTHLDVYKRQAVCISGKLEQVEAPRNPGEFDSRQYYACQHIYYFMKNGIIKRKSRVYSGYQQFLLDLKDRIHTVLKLSAGRDAPVFEAMLLGEKSELDQELKLRYQMAGMVHILAISGLHISILGMGLFSLCLLYTSHNL